MRGRTTAGSRSSAPRSRSSDAPGIGLIHLNDIDDAIEDVKWIAENGLRGGVLLPLPSPSDAAPEAALRSPDYDRLWAVIQDCDLVINQHSGQGTPDYTEYVKGLDRAVGRCEMPFFVPARLHAADHGRRLRALPQAALHPDRVRLLLGTGLHAPEWTASTWAWKMGMMGEIDYSKDPRPLPEPPSFYAKRNCWYGASFPSPQDIRGRDIVGVDRILWGNDYPHYEGCYPYSRENMRLAFSDVTRSEVRMMLGENAAALYGFDLEALTPAAEQVGIMPGMVETPLEEIPDSLCPTFQRAKYERQMAGAR